MRAEGVVGKQVGRYKVLGLIGRGGMGVVYRAAASGDEVVALKVMAPELALDDDFRERFIRESQVQVDHPNVIEVFEAGLADEVLYLTMRLVEGPDLKAVIGKEGRLLPARVVAIMTQACAALDAAHENGVVHRDIKPQNFLLDRSSGDERLFLTDFGLMKNVTSQSSLTASAHLMGTVQYMSPEQIRNRPIDGRADIYSLGCVLYECLTGSVPYIGREEVAVLFSHINDPPPKVSERVPVLPNALDDIVSKAMAKDPADRYLAAGDLAADLEATLLGARSSQPLWGDLAISRSMPPRQPETATESALVKNPRRGGVTAGLIAAVSLVLTAVVLTGGDPRRPGGGPIGALLDIASQESPLIEARDRPGDTKTDSVGKDERRDSQETEGNKTNRIHPRLVEVGSARSRGGTEREQAPDQRNVEHPAPGTYVFEQSGREALCPSNSGCIEGSDLPDTAETRVSEVGSTSATDEVSNARISDRFGIASFLVYRPSGTTLRETVMSFRTSHGAFEVRLRPEPPAELLRNPLEAGERWRGSWISAPTEGSYSIEVLARDRNQAGNGMVDTVRVKTIIRWNGQHAGSLQMTSWVDPDTRVTVESVVQVRARTGEEDLYYEATFHHVLTRGPGYPARE